MEHNVYLEAFDRVFVGVKSEEGKKAYEKKLKAALGDEIMQKVSF